MSGRRERGAEIISVWEDLKRRNVYRVGVGYIAFAWLFIQFAEIIFPRIGFPDWSITLTVVILLLGLPVALILGWVFEITPKGVIFDRPKNVDWRTYLLIDSFIIAALAAATAIYWFRIDVPPQPAGPAQIAVLPFTSIGDGANTDAVAVGLADELLTSLAQLEELSVSSRIAAEHFRDRPAPLSKIAADLKVRYLVEGSVQEEANRFRVTVQLIDVDNNTHLWAGNYEEPTGRLLSVRSQMAEDIIKGLNIALPIDSAKALTSSPTDNGDAFVQYLKGKEYLRRSRNDTNLAAAERYFSEAAKADPRFGAAYAGLCQTYLGRFIMEKDTGWFEAAEKSCHRALTLNDEQASVYVALGELYHYSSQHDKALEHFETALRIAPRSADAEMKRGITLDQKGRFTDAETALRKAVALEPNFWRAHNSLGRFMMRHARYDEAVEVFREVVELTPRSNTAFNNLAAALYMTGDEESAIAAFGHSIEIEPSRTALMNAANMHYYRAEYDKAALRYEHAAELMPRDDRPLGGLAASVRFLPKREAESEVLFSRAAKLVEENLRLEPTDKLAWSRLANYRAYAGEPDMALSALEKADVRTAADLEVMFFGCLTYMALGKQEEAIDLVESLAILGYTKDILRKDPDLAPIRGNARVVAALAADE